MNRILDYFKIDKYKGKLLDKANVHDMINDAINYIEDEK